MSMKGLRQKRTHRDVLILVVVAGLIIISFIIFSDGQETQMELLPDNSKIEDNKALEKVIYDYYLTFRYDDQGRCPVFEDGDYEVKDVDLNDDGREEYIATIISFCGEPVRGASGNGEFLVIQQNAETGEYIMIGEISGQEFAVVETDKMGGYSSILTSAHSTVSRSFIHEWEWNVSKKMYVESNLGFTVVADAPMVDAGGYVYRFISEKDPRFSIGEVASLVSYPSGIVNGWNYYTKDITGDDRQEIFVETQSSGSNVAAYEILTQKDDFLVNIKEENSDTNWIIFDEAFNEDDMIVLTWHGGYEYGKSYYTFNDNVLTLQKTVGAFLLGGHNATKYEYREIDPEGNVVYSEVRDTSSFNWKREDLIRLEENE